MEFNQLITRLNVILLALFSLISLTSYIAYRYYTAPPSGYCEGHIYVPDEKFIEKAVAEIGLDLRKFDGKNYSVINCCLVSRVEGDIFSKVLHRDDGVWVAFAYEKSQSAIEARDNNKKYSHLMGYFDSCANSVLLRTGDSPPFPPATFHGYGELEQDKVPTIIYKFALRYFVKWPK